MESCLCLIVDCEIRRNLAKRKCSNHSLSVESGRYLKLLTVFVNNVTELICHFLFERSFYTVTRQKFYEDNNICVDSKSKETFINLMKTKDKQLIVNLAKFYCTLLRRKVVKVLNPSFNKFKFQFQLTLNGAQLTAEHMS